MDNVPRINATMLKSYMSEYYQPQRMVLAGVGIDHERMVELGKKYFSVPKSDTKVPVEEEKAVWTGGVVLVRTKIVFDR